ncbi:MAG: PIN domain-containing protein [Candidatus Saccharimonadales bacterium]
MATKGSLDTSAIIRLLTNDIPAKRQQVAALIEATQGALVVPDVAIMETVFVLGRIYQFTRQEIARSVQAVMSIEQVECSQLLIDDALALFVDAPALSFEDCYLAAAAKHHDAAPFYTFDKKLAKQAPATQLIS